MTGMDNADQRADADGTAVSLAEVPVPLARYVVREGTVIVREVNDPFRATFPGSEGAPFRDWWREHDVSAADGSPDDICATLRDGEAVDATVTVGGPDATAYRLRGRPDTDSLAGTLTIESGPETAMGVVADEQIASVISHDLRNPLDVAKAHLTAAREAGDPEHFESLERAHDRMEQIIGDVLTLARNEGALTRSPGVDLDAVALDAWDTVDTVQASVTVSEGLPAVEADRDRLQRLFENLFRNAVEHGSTSPDSAAAAVRVGETETGFYVADDGPGVPPGERERVFEPGYSQTDGGTGLGLTIVERIAVAHGWTVTLTESAEGGARFDVRFDDAAAT
jgi:signal transduction histidine kinase